MRKLHCLFGIGISNVKMKIHSNRKLAIKIKYGIEITFYLSMQSSYIIICLGYAVIKNIYY